MALTSVEEVCKNIDKLSDNQLVELVNEINLRSDIVSHLAMQSMDEFDDSYADFAPSKIASDVCGNSKFNINDEFFTRERGVVESSSRETYVKSLRENAAEVAEAALDNVESILPGFAETLGLID